MISRTIDKKILAVWNRFKDQDKWGSVSLEDVKKFALEKNLHVISISEVDFGYMPMIKGVLLKTSVGSAIFPKQKLEDVELYQKNLSPKKNSENFWSYIDWFSPAFIPRKQIFDSIKNSGIDISNYNVYSPEIIQKRFEDALPSIYSLGNIIAMTEDVFLESETISQHVPIIRESILSFYSGMKIVAISSLIPIVENIITAILDSSNKELSIPDKVNRCIEKANKKVIDLHLLNADWAPKEYLDINVLKVTNERIFILETIRNWLLNSFYRNDEEYENYSGFNRHIFAHARSKIWQNPNNFFRALGVIQAMAFVECFAVETSKISIFPPIYNDNSKALHNEVIACMNFQAIKNEFLTLSKSSQNLPFNPTSSSDGWLLRAKILSNKMNDEVVTRLREKGWDCYCISDPIKDGEFITLKAKKMQRHLKVALLFSCASSNNLYKKLAEDHQYILYNGASYHQNSYAHNVNAVIRPLNAWIAPD